MPRPLKKRHICRQNLPAASSFAPDLDGAAETIILNIDEYETIRLLDGEGLTQQECAQRMGIARTSVQAIYESARSWLTCSSMASACTLKAAAALSATACIISAVTATVPAARWINKK